MNNKQLYFFALGRNVDLSLAEIEAVFRKENLPYKRIQNSKELALIVSDERVNASALNKKLGGIVKIGKCIHRIPIENAEEALLSFFTFQTLETDFLAPKKGKIEIGISIYSCGGKENVLNQITNSKSKLLSNIKDTLSNFDIKAHYPDSAERILSSASVGKNKLLTQGCEIQIIVTQDEILIGKTLAIQEFEEFSKRDFGRPVRDMESGTMPPKLARMMINLTQLSENKTLLDPFCGSGTVLQEALSLGYKNIIGTDISEKAIEDSKQNINWFLENIIGEKENKNITIKKNDVTSITDFIRHESIGAIVSEPYMGPTQRRKSDMIQLENIMKKLTTLYINAFKTFYKVLTPGGVVVFILPAFLQKSIIYFDIFSSFEEIGFSQISLSQTPRKSILVGNKHDLLLREIIKFIKPKV